MVAPPPYIVNNHSKSMTYDQYLVSLAHEDNKEALADEYAYRLDDMGNVFIAGETEELDPVSYTHLTLPTIYSV